MNPYDVLGVAPGADPTEIQAAYQRAVERLVTQQVSAATDDERRAVAARRDAVEQAYREVVSGETVSREPTAWGETTESADSVPLGETTEPAGVRPRRSGFAVLVGLAVVGLVAAVLVGVLADDPELDWDPRVVDLVAFVERERGLEFEEPVEVVFFDDEEYEAEVRAAAELDDDDRVELERLAGALRALGLLEGDVDLFEEVSALVSVGTVGLYRPEEKRMLVRGLDLEDPFVRATVVHELVHALQDQHFDLGRLDELDGEEESLAFLALVEGDAVRIERAYLEQLTPDDLDEYFRRAEEGLERAELETFPTILVTMLEAPYTLGEGFTEVLYADGGDERIDGAFRAPPTTEADVFDPWRFVGGVSAEPVDPPPLGDGEDPVDDGDGDFGALSWYLVLSERIDPLDALAVADAWVGGSSVLFEHAGRSCIRARFAAPSDGLDSAERALTDWIERLPGGDARLERAPDWVELRSCDPGTEAAGATTGASADALVLPVARAVISAQVVRAGVGVAVARCYASEIVTSVDPAVLTDETAALDPDLVRLTEAAFERCLAAT